MKKLFQFTWVFIVLLAFALVFVSLILYKPGWFSFQPSFGQNVSTLAIMLTALVTLTLASAAFKNIHDTNEREKRDRKERLLNEIIEWVSEVKRKTVPTDIEQITYAGKGKYEIISLSLSGVMLEAELIKLRATENTIPVVDELDNVWQSAFYCAQLASRIIGNTPSVQQRKSWSQGALNVVKRIDELEKQGKLTDEAMYHGQKKLLEDISACLKALVKIEANF